MTSMCHRYLRFVLNILASLVGGWVRCLGGIIVIAEAFILWLGLSIAGILVTGCFLGMVGELLGMMGCVWNDLAYRCG